MLRTTRFPRLVPVTDRHQPSRVWTLLLAGALMLSVGGAAVTATAVLSQVPEPPAPVPVSADRQALTAPSGGNGPVDRRAARPVRLHIPALRARSPIIRVGLNVDGTMEVPAPGPDHDKAAWFTGSAVPGAAGPAVIVGHVDGPKGPSVFYGLGAMRPGDPIHLSRADGSTITFTVYDVGLFDKTKFPSERVYADTAGSELRLITCGGKYDRDAGYAANTVVFARRSA